MSVRTVKRVFLVGDQRVEVEVHVDGDRLEGRVSGPDGSSAVEAAVYRTAPDQVALRVDDTMRRATLLRQGGALHVCLDGHVFVLEAEEGARERGGKGASDPFAASPMTGTVAKVAVAPGASVDKGGELFVVEAMKMEFVVRAPRAVVVGEVRKKTGEKVALGEVVVTFGEAP